MSQLVNLSWGRSEGFLLLRFYQREAEGTPSYKKPRQQITWESDFHIDRNNPYTFQIDYIAIQNEKPMELIAAGSNNSTKAVSNNEYAYKNRRRKSLINSHCNTKQIKSNTQLTGKHIAHHCSRLKIVTVTNLSHFVRNCAILAQKVLERSSTGHQYVLNWSSAPQKCHQKVPKSSKVLKTSSKWETEFLLRTFWGLFQDLSTVLGPFEDQLRTFWGHFEDILRAWGSFDDLLRIFEELRTYRGPFEDLLRTFWGPIEDLLRTFWGPFEDLSRIFWARMAQFRTKLLKLVTVSIYSQEGWW